MSRTGERNRESRVPEGPTQPSAGDAERAERLREILDRLMEVNRELPIIVEGRKDTAALRALGFVDEIINLHGGHSLHEFCEETADYYPRVVLLLDWDPEGEELMRKVGEGLRGYWEEHARLREALRAICWKEVKDVEGIPKLLGRLEGGHGGRRE